jgi:predicted nucleic acid-binding protein
MNGPGATPIFVDTGAFYARADEDDNHHETATRLFEAIRSGDIAYRPIFTSHSVLAELATLALYKLGHGAAVRTLNAIRDSESINIVPVGRATFESAADQFEDYDDQEISFVDHTTSVLAAERDIEHIFAFDSDFRTLGFTLVPEDLSRSDI